MSHAQFYTELEERDAALEAARAEKDTAPDEWVRVKTDYAEWRRSMRLLGGRPIGAYPWPGDVVDFMAANPDDPRVIAAKAARADDLRAELADLEG